MILIYLVLFGHAVLGQQHPYYFSQQIDSIIKADSTPWKYQTASWYYSFIGDYPKSLETKDRQYPNAKKPVPTQDQKRIIENYHPVNAKDYILQEALKTRILIINEAHHNSSHRAFVAGLLHDLNAVGYQFIGLEALNYEDSTLNQRKYPSINSGLYISDPAFGNLVREAFEAGFHIFPYEQKYQDSLQSSLSRERAQAENIKKLLDINPKSKFIVYCGYDHVVEDSLKNFMGLPMAGELKKMTGIDPFTIDQTVLSEYFVVGSRYRPLINVGFDALLIDSLKQYFNQASAPKKVDCNLYHPDTRYIGHRPHWRISSKYKFCFFQSKFDLEYPYLIKIYKANEDISQAVPIDVIEIKSENDQKASILLKRQKQLAVAINSKGDIQKLKIGKSGRISKKR